MKWVVAALVVLVCVALGTVAWGLYSESALRWAAALAEEALQGKLKFGGLRGALAGILGLIAGPSLVVIALGVLYEHTQNDPHIKHLFAGLAASAAGLLVAMAVKILMPLRQDPRAAAIAALGFVAIALLRFPLLPTMLVLTPLSIFLASRVAKAEAAAASAQPNEVSK